MWNKVKLVCLIAFILIGSGSKVYGQLTHPGSPIFGNFYANFNDGSIDSRFRLFECGSGQADRIVVRNDEYTNSSLVAGLYPGCYDISGKFGSNAERPTFFSFYISPSNNPDNIIELGDDRGGRSYLIGKLNIAWDGRLYLNNSTTPTEISGYSNLYWSSWYLVTASINYSSQTVSWKINNIDGSSAANTQNFMAGAVVGNVNFNFYVENRGMSQGTYLLDDIYFGTPPDGINGYFLKTDGGGTASDHMANGWVGFYNKKLWGTYKYFSAGEYQFASPQVIGDYTIQPSYSNCLDFSPSNFDGTFGVGASNLIFWEVPKSCTSDIYGSVSGGVPNGTSVDLLDRSSSAVLASTTITDGNFYFARGPGTYRIRINNACFNYSGDLDFAYNYFGSTNININATSRSCTVAMSGHFNNDGSGIAVKVRNRNTNAIACNATTNGNGDFFCNIAPGPYKITHEILTDNACYDISPTGILISPPWDANFDVTTLGGQSTTMYSWIKRYTLTTNSTNGRINGNYSNSLQYNCNASVPMNAQADGTYHFNNWTGNLSGSTNPTSIVMNGNKNVGASFGINTYTVAATSTNGANPGISPSPQPFNHGIQVTITASCNTGYSFSNWTGTTTGTTNPLIFNITKNENVNAVCVINKYTVAATSTNGAAPSISPTTQPINHGTQVTISPNCNTGYRFSNWTGTTTGTANPLIFNITKNENVNAVCVINTYTVAATSTNGSAPLISPGTQPFNYNTQVTVTPVCNTGYHFNNWTGTTTSTANPLIFNINKNENLNAVCVINVYTLTVNQASGGTITNSPTGTQFNHGQGVDLTASANSCNDFTGWTGAASGTTIPYRLTMDGPKTVSANFPIKVYTLTATSTNGSAPTRNPPGPTYNCASPATVVTVTPNCTAPNVFVNWTGDVSSTQSSLSLTMNRNYSVNAVCGTQTFNVSVNTTTGGTATLSPSKTVFNQGELATFTATVTNSNYEFVNWTGTVTSTNPTLSFNITQATNETANFRVRRTTLTLVAPVGGRVDISPTVAGIDPIAGGSNNQMLATDSYTLTATANSGYRLNRWEVNGVASGTSNSLSLNMSSSRSVVAVFERMYTLTLLAQNGTLTPNIAGPTYPAGSTVRVTGAANSGYALTGLVWQEQNHTSRNQNFGDIAMTSDITAQAYFAPIAGETGYQWVPIENSNLSGRYGVLFSAKNKMWILTGTSILSSTDGKTWVIEAATTPITGNHVRFSEVGNYLFAMNDANGLWRSTNGRTWTSVTGAPFATYRNSSMIAYQNKLFVGFGNIGAFSNSNQIWSTTDGSTWSAATTVSLIPGRESPYFYAQNNRLWLVGGLRAANTGGSGTPISPELYKSWHQRWSSADGLTWQVEPDFPDEMSQGLSGESYSGDFIGKKWFVSFEHSPYNYYQFFNSTDGRAIETIPYLKEAALGGSGLGSFNGQLYRFFTNSGNGSLELKTLRKVVTFTVNSTAGGTVSRDITRAQYYDGETIELTANPSNGYAFVNWTGSITTTVANPVKVKLNGNTTVTANFIPSKVYLTIKTSTNGTIVAETRPNPDGSYNYGQQVTVRATPSNPVSQKLLSWTDDASGNSQRYTLTMNGNKTVGANFGPKSLYTLTQGTVTNGTMKLLTKPDVGTNQFWETTQIQMSATPQDRYEVSSWTGPAAGITTRAANFFLTANSTVSVNFALQGAYRLQIVQGDGSSSQITVIAGDWNPITTVTVPGKAFDGWVVSSVSDSRVQHEFRDKGKLSATFRAIKLNGAVNPLIVVKAAFSDPKIDIYPREMRANKNSSRPQLKIEVKNAVTLTNFSFDYYFKMECSAEPILNGVRGSTTASLSNNWSVQLIDEDGRGNVGGNWILRYTTTNALPGKQTYETPNEVELTIYHDPACTQCSNTTWDLLNDASSIRIATWGSPLFVYRNANPYIPAYVGNSPRNLIYGAVPRTEADPAPDDQPGIKPDEPVPNPIPTLPDLPNLTFDQAYPTGQLVLNGSFEHDTLNWEKFGAAANIDWIVKRHTADRTPQDGLKYMVITPKTTAQEGLVITIDETHPAFKFIDGQNVTLSCWLRAAPEVTGARSVQLLRIDGNSVIADPAASTFILGTDWSYAVQNFYAIPSGTMGGLRTIRIGILENTGAQNLPIEIDNVTLNVGTVANPSVATYKWSGTRNAPMQERLFYPGDNFGADPYDSKMITQNTQYDFLGREDKTYLPTISDCGGNGCLPWFNKDQYVADMSLANTQWVSGNLEGLPDAGGYAYAQKEYGQDQGTSMLRSGAPGTNFRIGAGHEQQAFYSGVNSLDTNALVAGQSTVDLTNPASRTNPLYAYQAAKDQNGTWSLTWKNSFGQVLQSAYSLKRANGSLGFVVSQTAYDARGNVKEAVSPMACTDRSGNPTLLTAATNCVTNVKYEYDAEARVIKEIHPDAGETWTWYDLGGRPRISQTEMQRKENTFTVIRFDDLGRTIEQGIYFDEGGSLQSWESVKALAEDLTWPYLSSTDYIHYTNLHTFYYDKMPDQIPSPLVGIAGEFKLYPDDAKDKFTNTKGRLCAVITRQFPVDPVSSGNLEMVDDFSSVAYKYDKYGKVLETYTFNPYITNPKYKLQMIAHDYDPNGRLIAVRNFDQGNVPNLSHSATLEYDGRGQIKVIRDAVANTVIASFSYFPNDLKLKRVVLDVGQTDAITIDYTYAISGGIDRIKAVRRNGGTDQTLYEEDLDYDASGISGVIPQYTGNISGLSYFIQGVPTAKGIGTRQIAYQYDDLSRLVEAAFSIVGDADAGHNALMDAKYAYDKEGRITQQRVGTLAAGNGTGGRYNYNTQKHQLVSIDAGMVPGERDRSAVNNYVYDAGGQLMEDKSKNLKIAYDYRGLPLSFYYKGSDNKTYQFVARYDHAGNRIAKLEFEENGAAVRSGATVIDANSSRIRDYSTFVEAYSAEVATAANATPPPSSLEFLLVYDTPGQLVDMVPLTLMRPVAHSNGINTIPIHIKAIGYGSNEYWDRIQSTLPMALVRGTNYTGVGNEIRQSGMNTTLVPNIYTDLPSSLGRYQTNSAEKEYTLKNHLGSTMLVAKSDVFDPIERYDYWPYGRMDTLSTRPISEKTMPAFTSKELDDAISLMYFGARYYDPEVGMWISPDAGRQFANAYSYGEPINSTDPDGRLKVKAYQIVHYDDVDLEKGMVVQNYKTQFVIASDLYVRAGNFVTGGFLSDFGWPGKIASKVLGLFWNNTLGQYVDIIQGVDSKVKPVVENTLDLKYLGKVGETDMMDAESFDKQINLIRKDFPDLGIPDPAELRKQAVGKMGLSQKDPDDFD